MTKISRELFSRNLCELSKIIVKEKKRLLQQYPDPVDDCLFRSAKVWRTYFINGTLLSSDGVETSIFGPPHIQDNPVLESFNKYPGSSNAYSSLTQNLCMQFLMEEGLISKWQDRSTLSVAYSFGSHEGLMRVARILYKRNVNDGIFFASGSNGSTAIALRDLKPLKYKVFLVNVDGNRGEKILLTHLEKLIRENPSAKVLYLELKTAAGAIYTETELREIILFCQKYRLRLIASAAQLHMEFEPQYKFPIVSHLCNELGYIDYAVLFTASQTYGLERARFGLVLFDTRNESLSLDAMDNQFIRMFGTFSDLPIVAAYSLMTYPLEERQAHLKANIAKHRFNLNLMLAYIDGIDSKKIDEEVRTAIRAEIPQEYQNGIKGLQIICMPQGGIHLKVDLSQFKEKYFLNIQMFNCEILGYVFNKVFGVVTHFQGMDPLGYGMRLSFASKKDVHAGMRLMHEFLNSLTDEPQPNPFMKNVVTLEWLMSQSEVKIADTKRCRGFSSFFSEIKREKEEDKDKVKSSLQSKL